MLLIRGKIYFTNHSIKRYKDRVLTHRQFDDEDLTDNDIKKMIKKDINYRQIKEIVDIDNMKFVFTNNHFEFRFERTKDNGWLLITVIRYKRLMPHQEPPIEEYLKNTKQESGIRTAIAIRKRQKQRYLESCSVDEELLTI